MGVFLRVPEPTCGSSLDHSCAEHLRDPGSGQGHWGHSGVTAKHPGGTVRAGPGRKRQGYFRKHLYEGSRGLSGDRTVAP